ncbi:unnamed protein product [Ilex paraguariensis]|uniref:Aminomethyltransferase folate-binding domain-containing protein n=1 Tax=Ilex paraguariensis TaxID=185542 RepID=A0ABC8S1P3_9AQUA
MATMYFVSQVVCTACSFCGRRVNFRRCSISPSTFTSHQYQNAAFRTRNLSLPSTTSDALPFDLSPPPIDHDLLDTLTVAGAKASEDGIIKTFDNDEKALDAVDNAVVVVDLSHYGRIRVSGEDRVQFLHNQSTANFECLREGQVNG